MSEPQLEPLTNNPPTAILLELATLRNIAEGFIKSVDSLEGRLTRLQQGLENHLGFLGEDIAATQNHATAALDAIETAAKTQMNNVKAELDSKTEATHGARSVVQRMLDALKGIE